MIGCHWIFRHPDLESEHCKNLVERQNTHNLNQDAVCALHTVYAQIYTVFLLSNTSQTVFQGDANQTMCCLSEAIKTQSEPNPFSSLPAVRHSCLGGQIMYSSCAPTSCSQLSWPAAL